MTRFHPTRSQLHLVVTAGLILLGAEVSNLCAQESITVTVSSGRQFTGSVDSRTDANRLWLRTAAHSIVLVRPIDWERIASARVRDKTMSAAELQAAAAELKTVEPPREPTAADTEPVAPPDSPPNRRAATRQVQSIEIYATLGHWMSGVEDTGIVVTLLPFDADGHLTPVDGTLDVDLMGQRFTVVTEGNGFPRIGRWTAAVHAGDFSPSGAVYRFPFQAVHPDFQFTLDPQALVHVRLSVPGQGAFETSQAMVRIRAYSPVRDRAEQYNGSRFLPEEEVGDPR